MKIVKLSKSGSLKVKRREFFLTEKDCADLAKSFIPGEWAQFVCEVDQSNSIGFINLGADKGRPIIHIMGPGQRNLGEGENEFEVGWTHLLTLLERARNRRNLFSPYRECARIAYGMGDGLPGLVVDKYENCLLIQIHTAGLDRYRGRIKDWFGSVYPDVEIFLYDDKELRKGEALPLYEEKITVSAIVLKENNFILNIPVEKIQKAGYYFDHRNNRERLEKILKETSLKKDKGLDLFCYAGVWGLHQLRAGVQAVTWVDQGDFGAVVDRQREMNLPEGKGKFIRQDVFKFLDEARARGEKFDVITCDPPAFAKSPKDKLSAIGGYQRLHQKLMRVMGDRGILSINSCTKYVNFEELDRTVAEAALKEGKKVFLLDLGLQGFDHPMESFRDQGHYLKGLVYYVENPLGDKHE